MRATPSSAHTFIIVDPVQDYEESLTILGVAKSFAAAKFRAPALMKAAWKWEPNRYVEIQEWRGDTLVTAWTYRPGIEWKVRKV